MRIVFKSLALAAIAMSVLIFAGCGSDNNNKEQKNDSLQTDTEQVGDNTFYLIPSPEDMFGFSDDKALIYNPKLLNPKTNIDKYMDTRAKELNFGIYSADMAYSAAFHKYQESVEYLKTVRELSNDIGLSAVFDESLIKRIDNIINDKDSLKRVTSDSYYDIVRYLEKNDRKRSLALIVTGGWLESMYVVTNLVTEFKEKSGSIQRIADQKQVFDNLLKYLNQQGADENIQATIKDLEPVKAAYDKIEEVSTGNADNTDNANAANKTQIVVGGSKKVVITAEQYKALKEAISTVRNKLTGNVNI